MRFRRFQHIPDLQSDCIITELIDGMTAQIAIWEVPPSRYREVVEDTDLPGMPAPAFRPLVFTRGGKFYEMRAGGPDGWLTPISDKFGFAKWVEENAEFCTALLAPGRNHGVWFGPGIGRDYAVTKAMFAPLALPAGVYSPIRVPVLHRGPFYMDDIEAILEELQRTGSKFIPGYMNPAGIVIEHCRTRKLFKIKL